MKRILCILPLVFGMVPLQAEDVKMESNTSETVLLKLENLSANDKTLVKVLGGSYSNVGVDVSGVHTGVWSKGTYYGVRGTGVYGVRGEGGNTGLVGVGLYGRSWLFLV